MRTRPIYVLAGALLAAVALPACGSAYDESYASRSTTRDYSSTRISNGAILDIVWENQSPVDRASVCAEVRIRGAYAAALIVAEEATDFSPSEIARKLEEWC